MYDKSSFKKTLINCYRNYISAKHSDFFQPPLMFNRAHFLYKYHRKCNVIKETDDTTQLKINYYTLINKAVASNLIWAPGISFQVGTIR